MDTVFTILFSIVGMIFLTIGLNVASDSLESTVSAAGKRVYVFLKESNKPLLFSASFVVGAVIVMVLSFITSGSEMAMVLMGVVLEDQGITHDTSDIGVWGFLGSWIFNFSLIAVIHYRNKTMFGKPGSLKGLLFIIVACIVTAVAFTYAAADNVIQTSELVWFGAILFAFTVFFFFFAKEISNPESILQDEEETEDEQEGFWIYQITSQIFSFVLKESDDETNLFQMMINFVISVIGIISFSVGFIFLAEKIGMELNLNGKFMGLTTSSTASSLPELMVILVLVKKGKSSMAALTLIFSNFIDVIIGTPLAVYSAAGSFSVNGNPLIIGLSLLAPCLLILFYLMKADVNKQEPLTSNFMAKTLLVFYPLFIFVAML